MFTTAYKPRCILPPINDVLSNYNFSSNSKFSSGNISKLLGNFVKSKYLKRLMQHHEGKRTTMTATPLTFHILQPLKVRQWSYVCRQKEKTKTTTKTSEKYRVDTNVFLVPARCRPCACLVSREAALCFRVQFQDAGSCNFKIQSFVECQDMTLRVWFLS